MSNVLNKHICKSIVDKIFNRSTSLKTFNISVALNFFLISKKVKHQIHKNIENGRIFFLIYYFGGFWEH